MAPDSRDGTCAPLAGQREAETFRFITCGSVDDGKSTLIGRLLYESKAVFDDQLASLERDSRQYGTQGEHADLALLVDGLQAEREQGITIDVAYRFFATARRRYIVADTPGHEQYTRNMATGASTADLAVILVDARKGVLTQTRRHTRIAAMMGIRHVVLAVNKIDLVGFDADVFAQLAADYAAFAAPFGFAHVQAIPVSALGGDNVLRRSANTAWYEGPSLMEYLDGLDIDAAEQGAFRMPVQWVNRPNPDFRGLCGRIAAGSVRVGDELRVLPSGLATRVARIVSGFADVDAAGAGESVTVVLADEVDASRGDVLAAAAGPPALADRFEAKLLWMGEQRMTPGRQYLIKLGAREATATVTRIRYVEDVNSGQQQAASSLAMNGIATVDLATSFPLVFEPYRRSRALGGFILVDKLTFATVGAGMIESGRCRDVHWQALDVDKAARALQKNQTPRCIWFTGLSGSGKSTLANLLEKRLHIDGKHTYLLDGDNVRQGLNCDLGFTEADRVENMRRVAEVAKLMVDAGLIVLVSFISPFKNERRMARELFREGEFVEVFVDTPIAECERRDVKGLYSKARKGALKNFTGIDSPYERPELADVIVQTLGAAPEACVGQILRHLDSPD